MLKIGSIRWRGKCSRHPGFDPVDGPGAIRGGCPRCSTLVEIHACHQRMLTLMRSFAPPPAARKAVSRDAEAQASLFGEL